MTLGQPRENDPSSATATLRARRDRVLGSAYRLFYDEPIEVVRGEGAWLWDAQGNRYLDAYNNVAVVGHANPRVARAMAEQATLVNTHTRYLHPLLVTYAERLTALMPPPLDTVMLTCTGSEANDLAVRLATTFTGGSGIIVTRHAYHGVTAAIAAASPALGLAVGAHVRTVAPPRPGEGAAAERFAADVSAAAAELAEGGHPPAALLVDSVLSSDGLVPEPAGFLAGAADAIRAAGGLFIADEVQAGFGRTGTLWGFERHGVTPDLVTLGKPMGNGHPVAGVIHRREIGRPFGAMTRYFNTFAGSPVSCAAGLAVLDELVDRQLVEHARDRGADLLAEVRRVAAPRAGVQAVRGVGLFVAVELVSADLAAAVVNDLRSHGVLIAATGPGGRTLKVRPPLVMDDSQVERLVTELGRSLRRVLP